MRAGAEPRLPPCMDHLQHCPNITRSMRAGAEPRLPLDPVPGPGLRLMRSMRAGAEPRLPPGTSTGICTVSVRSMRAGAEPRLPQCGPQCRRAGSSSLNEGRGRAPATTRRVVPGPGRRFARSMRAGAEPRLPRQSGPRMRDCRGSLNEGRGRAPATTNRTTANGTDDLPTLNEGRGRAPATTPCCCVWEHYATFSRSAGCRYMFPVFVCQGSLRVRSGAAISR